MWHIHPLLGFLVDRIEDDGEREDAVDGDQHVHRLLDPDGLKRVDDRVAQRVAVDHVAENAHRNVERRDD